MKKGKYLIGNADMNAGNHFLSVELQGDTDKGKLSRLDLLQRFEYSSKLPPVRAETDGMDVFGRHRLPI